MGIVLPLIILIIIRLNCTRCNKKFKFLSTKYYFFNDSNKQPFPFDKTLKKKDGELLCEECYDKAMEKAGWEIRYSIGESSDKINYVKSYVKHKIEK